MYLSSGGSTLNQSLLQSFNAGPSLFQPSLLNTTLDQNKTTNISLVSSNNTFDLYKLNMSKDMTVLRRHYDRIKHETK
jgi:hypothetical protein